jgi:hypothetical protein
MSIKKKFATAVATAGLLAGLFGSAFVMPASAFTITAPDWEGDEWYEIETTPGDQNGVTVYCDIDDEDDWMPGADNSLDDGTRGLIGDGVEVPNGLSAATACPVHSPTAIDENGEEINYETALALDFTTNHGLPYSSGIIPTEQIEFAATVSGQATVYYNSDEDCYVDVEDYGTSAEWIGDADDYMYLCIAPTSSDASGTGSVTVTATHNGKTTTLDTWYLDFYGPATSLSFGAQFINRVADEDNWSTISYLVFKDAAGTDLGAAGMTVEDAVECVSEDDLGSNNDSCSPNDEPQVHFIVDGDPYANNYEDDVDVDVWFSNDGYDDEGWMVEILNVCTDLEKDAGDTFTVRAFLDLDDDIKKDTSELQTGALTFTCTGDMDGASIESISVAGGTQRASTLAVDRTLDLVVNVVDENGDPMGYVGDGVCIDYADETFAEDFEAMLNAGGGAAAVDPTTNLDLGCIYALEGKGLDGIGDGHTYFGDFTPEPFELTVGSIEYAGWNELTVIIDDNLAFGGGDEAELSFSYRVASKVVALTASGMTVTANFGAYGAGKTVTLLVEKLNGDVVYRSVIANSVGKITKTFKGKQKVVTAFLGSVVTNTVTVK